MRCEDGTPGWDWAGVEFGSDWVLSPATARRGGVNRLDRMRSSPCPIKLERCSLSTCVESALIKRQSSTVTSALLATRVGVRIRENPLSITQLNALP